MYPYVICFCGRPLGDLYDFFKAAREELMQQAHERLGEKIKPMFMRTADDIKIQLKEVLDALNLHTECCRIHILTQVEFDELY